MSSQLLIDAQHLHRYYGTHAAVQDVTLSLQKGEVLGLLGPNGAGKSSTLQMLSGNLAPSAGQITVNGIDLLERAKAAKQHLGYLPERAPLYPDLTVEEYLRYCARLRRIPTKRIAQAVEQAKRHCGLLDTARRLIGNLSKGYQQRLGIAQAIIHTPPVIILDEPTVGLDPIQIRHIRQLIRRLGQNHGVVLSTHILPEVQAICDRVQIIAEGRTVFNERLAALASESDDTTYRVSFATPPPHSELKAVPGVGAVQPLAQGTVRVELATQTDVGALVFAAVEHGWGLRELTPQHATLETIFMNLVYSEQRVESIS